MKDEMGTGTGMNEEDANMALRGVLVEDALERMQRAALALEDVARALTALYPGDAEEIAHARQAEGAAWMLDQWSHAIEVKEK